MFTKKDYNRWDTLRREKWPNADHSNEWESYSEDSDYWRVAGFNDVEYWVLDA